MGLFKILKVFSSNDQKDNEKLEKEMDRYNLNKEEKEEVRKGYYQPDEFDRDDDLEDDEDEY